MKKTAFTLIILIAYVGCRIQNDNLVFTPITDLNYNDTIHDRGKILSISRRFYLVSDYIDNEKSNSEINKFALSESKGLKEKAYQFSIIFYKESEKTNINSIKSNPKIIDRYSNENDMIYEFTWINGKLIGKFKYKNGEIVDPKSEIQVLDINDTVK